MFLYQPAEDFYSKGDTVETQSANYPEAYKDEIMKTIRTVVNDETNDSISYIFITDMHIDTSEETREVAYNQLYAIVDIANNSDIDFVCVGGDMYNGRYADPNGKVIAMDTIESISKILEPERQLMSL